MEYVFFCTNALARVEIEQIGKIQRVAKDLLPLEAEFLAPTVIIQLSPLLQLQSVAGSHHLFSGGILVTPT